MASCVTSKVSTWKSLTSVFATQFGGSHRQTVQTAVASPCTTVHTAGSSRDTGEKQHLERRRVGVGELRVAQHAVDLVQALVEQVRAQVLEAMAREGQLQVAVVHQVRQVHVRLLHSTTYSVGR